MHTQVPPDVKGKRSVVMHGDGDGDERWDGVVFAISRQLASEAQLSGGEKSGESYLGGKWAGKSLPSYPREKGRKGRKTQGEKKKRR